MEGQRDVPQRVDQSGRQKLPVCLGVAGEGGAAAVSADQVDQPVHRAVPIPHAGRESVDRRRIAQVGHFNGDPGNALGKRGEALLGMPDGDDRRARVLQCPGGSGARGTSGSGDHHHPAGGSTHPGDSCRRCHHGKEPTTEPLVKHT